MSQQDELAEIFVDEFLKTPEGQEWLEWCAAWRMDILKYGWSVLNKPEVLYRPEYLTDEQWERITREWNQI